MAYTLSEAEMKEVVKLYIAYFNRAPEFNGLQFHIARIEEVINSGGTFKAALEERANNFYEAAISMPSSSGYSAAMATEDFVRVIYGNVPLRPGPGGLAPTDAEIEYWVARLENRSPDGPISRGEMVVQFLDAIPHLQQSGSAEEKAIANQVNAVLQNRITVGLEFVKEVHSGDLSGDAATLAGKAALAGVTGDPATVAAAIAKIIADDGPQPGGTFTLTTGGDFADNAGSTRNAPATIPSDFKFTDNNETVIATQATLTPGDVLNDASTTDKDLLQVAVAGGAGISLQTVTNIEDIDLNFNNFAGVGVDFAGVTGAKDVDLAGTLTFAINLNNVLSTGITNIDGSGLTSTLNGFNVNFAGMAGTAALTVIGSNAPDTIIGAGGTDNISGGGGDDMIDGGAGNDTLDGGDGNDTILGGSGNDTIIGGAGNDSLFGESGDDILSGGAGDDNLFLGPGVDIVRFEATGAGNGNDIVNDFLPGDLNDQLDFQLFLAKPSAFAKVTDNVAVAGLEANLEGQNVIAFSNTSGVTTIAQLINAIANNDVNLDAGNIVVMFETGGDTQVFFATTNVLGEITTNFQIANLVGVDADLIRDYNII